MTPLIRYTYGHIMNFSCTSQIHFCFKNTLKTPFKPVGKKLKTSLLLGDVDLHLIHPSLDRPHSPTKQHPDPISRFSTIHTLDWQRDQPTDWQTDRQIGWV